MMCANQIPVVLVALAAVYLIMVTVCVSGRMTKQTKPSIRWPITVLGGLACWALLRTVTGDWSSSIVDVSHAAIVVIGAAAMAAIPRIPT